MANLSDKASNVTDKTISDFYQQALQPHRDIQDAKDTLASAVAVLRGIYKKAKAAGVNEKVLAKLLAERLLDQAEVTKELHDYARARALIFDISPEQISMFVDLIKADGDADTKEIISLERAFDDGYFAGAEGHTGTLNPHHPGTEHHVKWHAGWMKGQTKLAQELTPKKKRGRPPAPKAGKLDPQAETATPESEKTEAEASQSADLPTGSDTAPAEADAEIENF